MQPASILASKGVVHMVRSLRIVTITAAILVGIVTFSAVQAQANAQELELPALRFTKLTVQPQAARGIIGYNGVKWDPAILTIGFNGNKLIAGYGDSIVGSDSVGDPKGRTAVREFDLTSKTWGPQTLLGSEMYEVVRTISGNQYIPVEMPSRFGSPGFATNKSGSLMVKHPASLQNARLLYDIQALKADGSDLVMVGRRPNPQRPADQNAAAATVWRSRDGGNTWNVIRSVSSEPAGYNYGWEAFMWAAVLDGKLYVQPANVHLNNSDRQPIQVFNPTTNSWSTRPHVDNCNDMYGGTAVVFDQKVVCGSSLDKVARLTVFDQTSSGKVVVPGTSGGLMSQMFVHNGYLYVMDYDGKIQRTRSLNGTWEVVGKINIPNYGSPTAIAVRGDTIYIGDSRATIWQAKLPQ